MKVIIDTNILVSAALKDRQPEDVVLEVACNQDYQWIVSTEIFSEYEEVLNRRRLNINVERRERFLSLVKNLTILIEVDVSLDFPRDRKDAKFLACAVASQADYLITGDKDFSEAQKLINSQIVSVSKFVELIEANNT